MQNVLIEIKILLEDLNWAQIIYLRCNILIFIEGKFSYYILRVDFIDEFIDFQAFIITKFYSCKVIERNKILVLIPE